MVQQTLAIFTDAYRELNARKMFWISLVISFLIISIIGIFGLNEKGLTILWFQIPETELLNAFGSKGFFYKVFFVTLGVGIWLSFGAMILSLVSTASIMPDFAASGTIECMLSRPISRARLFITKYFAGLMFVALQSLIFSLTAILMIGLRSGEWIWTILWCVPIITLTFSYLYSVSALIGVWTRSTLAALVAALIVWLVCFGVDAAENIMLRQRLMADSRIQVNQRDLENREAQLARRSDELSKAEDPAERKKISDNIEELQKKLKDYQITAKENAESRETVAWWYRQLYTTKTILPKTAETTEVIQRFLFSEDDYNRLFPDDIPEQRNALFSRPNARIERQANKIRRERSLWWVIGTSVGFQALVVGLGAFVFSRRDY